MHRTLTRLLLLATPLLPVAGQAQDASNSNENDTMPRCGPQLDGQVYCKFGILYECQLISPNAMERRTGWRWKADILRACAEPNAAKTDDRHYLPPPEVVCGPERTDDPDAQGGRGHAGASGRAGGSREGTMYIRPDGCPSSDR
jgi:hypothetical protein